MQARNKGLNPEQRRAADCLAGPLLVFAGAGSGKTTVITHRIKNLVDLGAGPAGIVAVTFTNKSAKEMRERLSHMGIKRRGMIVSTFHSLGNRILRRDIHHLKGYRIPFSILTPDEGLGFLADIYREMKLDPSDVKDDGMQFMISLCKNAGQTPDEFAAGRSNLSADFFEEIFRRYHEMLLSHNSVDFDDLILLPSRILKEQKEVRDHWQRVCRHVLVDEFQDTNPLQYSLLRLLADQADSICAVGDDDQSIYGWRGADVRIIINFQKDYPGTEMVRLETNYRSTSTILEAANAVIARNSHRVQKVLRSIAGPGPLLRFELATDEEDEASLTAEAIRESMIKKKRKPGDFAILYRTNYQSRAFEQALRRRNIPLHVAGGYSFFERREVRDMISYLRFIANPNDELAMMRIINRPRRGIGEGTLKKLGEFAMKSEKPMRVVDVLQRLVAEPGLVPGVRPDTIAAIVEFLELVEEFRGEFGKARKLTPVLRTLVQRLPFEAEFRREGDNDDVVRARLMNLSELVNMLSFMEENRDEDGRMTIFDFLAEIAMMSKDDDEEDTKDRVQLLTMHMAKGLEYPVVFLTGMEEGIFPSDRTLTESLEPEWALEEERRLFYVGITRAKTELFLTSALSRRRFGNTVQCQPSRFIDEIPEHLLENRPRTAAPGEEQNALTALLAGMD